MSRTQWKEGEEHRTTLLKLAAQGYVAKNGYMKCTWSKERTAYTGYTHHASLFPDAMDHPEREYLQSIISKNGWWQVDYGCTETLQPLEQHFVWTHCSCKKNAVKPTATFIQKRLELNCNVKMRPVPQFSSKNKVAATNMAWSVAQHSVHNMLLLQSLSVARHLCAASKKHHRSWSTWSMVIPCDTWFLATQPTTCYVAKVQVRPCDLLVLCHQLSTSIPCVPVREPPTLVDPCAVYPIILGTCQYLPSWIMFGEWDSGYSTHSSRFTLGSLRKCLIMDPWLHHIPWSSMVIHGPTFTPNGLPCHFFEKTSLGWWNGDSPQRSCHFRWMA